METDDSTGGKGARGERKDEEGKSLCREKRIHRLIEEDLKKERRQNDRGPRELWGERLHCCLFHYKWLSAFCQT